VVATELLLHAASSMPDVSPLMPPLMPAILQRMGHLPVQEPAEEVGGMNVLEVRCSGGVKEGGLFERWFRRWVVQEVDQEVGFGMDMLGVGLCWIWCGTCQGAPAGPGACGGGRWDCSGGGVLSISEEADAEGGVQQSRTGHAGPGTC
jgi:hypothetical protein